MRRPHLMRVHMVLLVAAGLGVTPRAAQTVRPGAPSWLVLRPGAVSVDVPPGLRFVPAAELRAAGPVGGGDALLGAFMPKEAAAGGGFAVTVLWLQDGHVAEDDVRDLDEQAVLSLLRAEADASNAARRAAGQPEITPLGFVEPPRYADKERVLTFVWRGQSGSEQRVCYDARKLTRAGVLACSAVGPEAEFARLATAINAVLAGVRIEPGQRYEDFVSGDPLSKWSLVKQVASGVFERLPWWQKLGLAALALSALFAVVRGLGRLLGR